MPATHYAEVALRGTILRAPFVSEEEDGAVVLFLETRTPVKQIHRIRIIEGSARLIARLESGDRIDVFGQLRQPPEEWLQVDASSITLTTDEADLNEVAMKGRVIGQADAATLWLQVDHLDGTTSMHPVRVRVHKGINLQDLRPEVRVHGRIAHGSPVSEPFIEGHKFIPAELALVVGEA